MLGPLEAVGAQGPVATGGPRPRRLLAALVLARGEVVSESRLTETVWGAAAPANPVHAAAGGAHVDDKQAGGAGGGSLDPRVAGGRGSGLGAEEPVDQFAGRAGTHVLREVGAAGGQQPGDLRPVGGVPDVCW